MEDFETKSQQSRVCVRRVAVFHPLYSLFALTGPQTIRQVHIFQITNIQNGGRKLGPLRDGIFESRPIQGRIGKVGRLQRGARKVGLFQVGLGEFRTLQISIVKIGIPGHGTGEILVRQVLSRKVHARNVLFGKIGGGRRRRTRQGKDKHSGRHGSHHAM